MARFVVGNDRRRRSIAADALDAVALDEDVTRKRFGAQAIDDPDIGESVPAIPPRWAFHKRLDAA
jgi:hypothetical protein